MRLSLQANDVGTSKIYFLFLTVLASGCEMSCTLYFQMIEEQEKFSTFPMGGVCGVGEWQSNTGIPKT